MRMIEGKVYFTQNDKENLCIREYSDKECLDRIKQYTKNNNMRRLLLFATFLFFLVLACSKIDPLSYIADIGILLVLAGVLLSESLHWLNGKRERSKFFVEARIIKKREVEIYYETSPTTGPESRKFYPIEGEDTSTGYKCLLYIDKGTYGQVQPGQCIKISVLPGCFN